VGSLCHAGSATRAAPLRGLAGAADIGPLAPPRPGTSGALLVPPPTPTLSPNTAQPKHTMAVAMKSAVVAKPTVAKAAPKVAPVAERKFRVWQPNNNK
jgi:hypothetical protein